VHHVKVTPDVLNRLMLGHDIISKQDFPSLLQRIEDYVMGGRVMLAEREELELFDCLEERAKRRHLDSTAGDLEDSESCNYRDE